MNPQANGATSRDWLEANRGMKIIAYVETATQTPLQRPHPSSEDPKLSAAKQGSLKEPRSVEGEP